MHALIVAFLQNVPTSYVEALRQEDVEELRLGAKFEEWVKAQRRTWSAEVEEV